MRAGRLIESCLRPFDNENRELIVRYRLWKTNWFPYRTAQLKHDITEEDIDGGMPLEHMWEPWRWNPPRKRKQRG